MMRSRTALLALVLAAISPAPSAAAGRGDPFEGAKFFVDPDSNATHQARDWRLLRPFDAMAIDRIARRSQADWFGDWNRAIGAEVRARVTQVRNAGALPVLVAYNIPNRDCGGHSAGGKRSGRAYLRWIRKVARGIGKGRAAVILEPDAVAAAGCLSSRGQRKRLSLLSRATKLLKRRSGASVYIDAGHSGWNSAALTAKRLGKAGIRHARGFSLNVSNFRNTATELAYGRQVGNHLGGKHFVIDTSRNGLGPSPDGQWCNSPGRALGQPPTAATADPLADAYLWIKSPGESDGPCNGGPPAGVWWPDYALGLAERTPYR
jgi:endoglucanase